MICLDPQPTAALEIERRAELYEAAAADRELAARLAYLCRRDFWLWRDSCVWLQDRDGNVLPSLRWPMHRQLQIDYLGLDGVRPNMVVEKGRELGGTQSLEEAALWAWAYKPGITQILVSRTEGDVDDSSDVYHTSLVSKLRAMIRCLPDWGCPPAYRGGAKPRGHDRFKLLVNPANGSSFLGVSTSANAARSKRAFRVLVDEANSIDFLEELLRSLSRVGPWCCLSSVAGRYTHFARLAHGEVQPLSERPDDGRLRKYRLHYSQRPDWSPEDIETMRAGMDAVTWAQEMELDYAASQPGLIWAVYTPDALTLAESRELRRKAVTWLHGWDFGQSHALTAWVSAYVTSDGVVVLDDYRQWRDTTAEQIAADLHDAGWYPDEPSYAVGDPSGVQPGRKTHNGEAVKPAKSWLDNLRRVGITVRGQTGPEGDRESSIALVTRYLTEGRLLVGPRCALRRPEATEWPCVLDALRGYHREDGEPETWSRAKAPQPVKDIYSHLADALQHVVWRANKLDVLHGPARV